MLEVKITNFSNANKPVVASECVDNKYAAIQIGEEAARVNIEEIERAIRACGKEVNV